jgi:hypothetical protein
MVLISLDDLDDLDDLNKTIDAAKSQLKSLNWKVSILKISTEKKKIRSRPSRKSRHLKKLVSISILIGLNCRDPQA